MLIVQLRIYWLFSFSAIPCCSCYLFNIKKTWKISCKLLFYSALLHSSCHCTFLGSFWHLLQILQEMSALFHIHLSLLRCHCITQAECKVVRNATVIMLTADTMWEYFIIGPYSCLNTLFIPMCLANLPGLVFLQVDQTAGNSSTYFHLGSLNIFKMSDNAGEIELRLISSYSASQSPSDAR